MKGLRIAFLFFFVLKVCYAGNLSHPVATVTPQPKSLSYLRRELLDEKPCEYENGDKFKYLVKSCPKVAPQHSYTESMNLVVLTEENMLLFRQFTGGNSKDDGKLINLCNVMSHPNYTNNGHADETLSQEQMCEGWRFIMIEPTKGRNMDEIAEFRQGCQIYTSVQKIATIDTGATAKLTPEQLEAFHEVGGQKCDFANCRTLAIAMKKCRFLNESVSSEEQAEQLGITVDLYEKLVLVRKMYTDKTNSGRLAQAKRSCEAINGVKSDGVNLELREHILKLSTSNLNKYTDLWIEYKTAPNAKKIASIKNMCAFLSGVRFE